LCFVTFVQRIFELLRQDFAGCTGPPSHDLPLQTLQFAVVFFTVEGIGITVIDLFTVKPVDKATILKAVRATGGRLITVEDHYPEGGIGSAVAEALSDETGQLMSECKSIGSSQIYFLNCDALTSCCVTNLCIIRPVTYAASTIR